MTKCILRSFCVCQESCKGVITCSPIADVKDGMDRNSPDLMSWSVASVLAAHATGEPGLRSRPQHRLPPSWGRRKPSLDREKMTANKNHSPRS